MSLGLSEKISLSDQTLTLGANPRLAATLNAWLKFGTVFLTYSVLKYFILDRNNPNAVLFDKQSALMLVFVLLGFAIYYLLVHPYVPVNFQHPLLQNIASDSLMFGTVLVSAHLMDVFANDGQVFNKEWLKAAGLVLLAFAIYRVVSYPFLPQLGRLSPANQTIVHDWAQFGVFFIALRALQGKSLMNKEWALSVVFALLGFTAYRVVTRRFVRVN